MHSDRKKVVRPAIAAALCSGILILAACPVAYSQDRPPADGKFDEFGNVGAEGAMARLDAFAVQLNSHPNLWGFIVGHNRSDYGGGWLLREAYGYVDYLVDTRGIEASRIRVVEGEFRRDIGFELWLLPTGAVSPVIARVPELEPTSPQRFDVISLGDEGQCVGQLFLKLFSLEDGLRFFGQALRQQSRAKAWIVIHPRVRESSATTHRTIDVSRNSLIKDFGISSERVLSAIGPRRSSICTGVNLWIAPSNSVSPDEAAYYSQLMDEAEKTEYTVRRVEFTGNTYTRDNILRRRFVQQEGDVFTRKALEQSLKNFSKLRMIYPVSLSDVEVRLDRHDKLMDFTIFFRERPRTRPALKFY